MPKFTCALLLYTGWGSPRAELEPGGTAPLDIFLERTGDLESPGCCFVPRFSRLFVSFALAGLVEIGEVASHANETLRRLIVSIPSLELEAVRMSRMMLSAASGAGLLGLGCLAKHHQ